MYSKDWHNIVNQLTAVKYILERELRSQTHPLWKSIEYSDDKNCMDTMLSRYWYLLVVLQLIESSLEHDGCVSFSSFYK